MIAKTRLEKHLGPVLFSAGLLALTAGCAGPEEEVGAAPTPLPVAKYKEDAQKAPQADAGVSVGPRSTALDPKLKVLAMAANYGSRPDPFALLPVEKQYEDQQTAERFLSLAGGYMTEWTPPQEAEPEVIEQQPYRRLAGVMVGTSVLALIDMGDGKIEIVRPGQTIGEWTVQSIDLEKAILTRKGNKKPHTIEVPVQKPLGGLLNPGGNRGGGFRGGPFGGPTGGPMGGFMGGPPMGGPMGGAGVGPE